MQKSRNSALFHPSNLPNPNGGLASAFITLFCLIPTSATASENLIEILEGLNATIIDDTVHQITADGRDYMQWKIQAIYGNQKHLHYNNTWTYEAIAHFVDDNIGWISYEFTTPDDLEDLWYFRFGLNGTVRDTLVLFNIKDVMPNTTYTIQYRVLNNTQGEVAWTDMRIVHCGDGYSLALGEENCSRACENQTATSGHIPPDKTTVYEPEICTYDIAHLTCDDGYSRVDNVCEQMCTAGITHLYVGNTVHGLYAQKKGSPALHIGYNDNVCYGHLAPGTGSGLNININGTIYHLID